MRLRNAVLALLCFPAAAMAAAPDASLLRIRTLEGSAGTVDVQFNPKEIAIAKQVTWQREPVFEPQEPIVRFAGGEPRTLKVPLEFDSPSQSPLSALEKMAQVDPELRRPPMCLFQWGAFQFKGVISTLTITYTKFRPDGVPLRASVQLEMIEAGAAGLSH